ncbi:MAG TPA: amidase [Acidimicrobiia bacterium]|nr:amidase [Acidimicrobiia bacterium]
MSSTDRPPETDSGLSGGRRLTRRQVLAAAAAAPVSLTLARSARAADAIVPPVIEPSSPNPADLSVIELLPLLEARKLSARELVESCIAQVERFEPEVKAFERPTFDLALAGARAADEARALGRPVGRLAGVPIGLKDLYYTQGIPTTASSKVLEDFVPDFDATVWERLQQAGMVLLGKLSSTEFAWGPNSPPTVNPWDMRRSPGGSSGGSGAALAARMVPAALGTDTGCSIVNPAAMCGVSGVKGTYGRCSRHGVISLAWSCDHAGPMARRMADCAVLLAVMAGHDPADPTTLEAPVPVYPTSPPPSLGGVRIGLPDRFYWEDIEPDVEKVCREGLSRLAAMGAEIVEVPAPPSLDEVLGEAPNPYGSLVVQGAKVLVKILLPESTSYHRRLAADRPHRYSPEILALVEAGETISAADYLDAQRLRSVWVREWRQLFASHRLDVVASPTVATKPTYQTPSQSFVFGPTYRLNQGFNLNGFPSCSVPVGVGDEGHPVGLQLAAAPLEEARLFAIAIALDEDVRFFERKPPLLAGVQ